MTGSTLFQMTTEIKNLQATAHNVLCRYDALRNGVECRAWGGESWQKFCDKLEDLRAAVALAEQGKSVVPVNVLDEIASTIAGWGWESSEGGHHMAQGAAKLIREAIAKAESNIRNLPRDGKSHQ